MFSVGDKVSFEMPGVTYNAEIIALSDDSDLATLRLEDGFEMDFFLSRLTKVN